MSGAFVLRGFTNQQLRLKRNQGRTPSDPRERRRESGRVTRLLRLLRAHGLISKVSRTRYYRTTETGRRIMSAALRLRDADVRDLTA